MTSRPTDFHRWIVAVSAAFVMAIDFGFFFSFGILFVGIIEEFRVSRARAAVVQSTLYGTVIGTGVLGGLFITWVGCRRASLAGAVLGSVGLMASFFASSVDHLIVCVGVVAGLGMSVLLITTVLVVGEHFDGKLRSAVVAAVASSSAIGGMAYPYVLTQMSQTFSLREIFLIVGGLFLNSIPAAFLWESGQRKKPRNDNSSSRLRPTVCSIIRSLLQKKSFCLFALGTSCVVPVFNAFLALISDILYDILGDRSQCVTVFFIFNLVSLVGRLLPGFLKCICQLKTIAFPILFAALGSVGFLLLNIVSGFAACICVACILSVSFGGMITVLSVVTMRMVGIEGFPVAVGVIYTMEGFLNLFTAPIAGFLREATESYTVVLFISAGFLAVACLIFSLAAKLQKMQRQGQGHLEVESHPETEGLEMACDVDTS